MLSYGYRLADCGPLPSIITPSQFAAITGGRMSSTTEQVQAMLDAVSAAVRAYCGWHIAPELECEWTGEAPNGYASLPVMGVEAIEAVTVNGEEIPEGRYEWSASGELRLCGCICAQRWRSLTVRFIAGYEDASAIGAVVAQIAANAMAAAPGVREEHAGSVGISYNQTASGVSGGVALLDRDRLLLDPWRIARI